MNKLEVVLDSSSNIQQMIQQAPENAILRLKPGIYHGGLLINKSLTLSGLSESAAKVVIDGQGAGGAVITIHGKLLKVIFKNLTITNGLAEAGGGVFVSSGQHTEIHDCVFRNNQADYYGGGGVYASAGKIIIQNTQFLRNFGRHGGGILLDGSVQATIQNTTFARNRGRRGGGMRIKENARIKCESCIFVDNELEPRGKGEAIYISGTMSQTPILEITDSILSSKPGHLGLFNAGIYPGKVKISNSLLPMALEQAEFFRDVGNSRYASPVFKQVGDNPYILESETTDADPIVGDEIDLSQDEYLFLLHFLQSPSVSGIENPYAGTLSEELEKKLSRALQSLQTKGVIILSPTGDWVIESQAKSLIAPCASAKKSLRAICTTGQRKRDTRFFHFAQQSIVEDAILSDERRRLTRIYPPDQVVERIREQFQLYEQKAVPGQKCTIPRLVLERITQTAEREEQVIRQLEGVGTNKRLASVLAKAIISPASTSVLARVDPETNFTDQELGILEVADGLLLTRLVENSKGEQVEVVPCDVATVLQHITDCVSQTKQEN